MSTTASPDNVDKLIAKLPEIFKKSNGYTELFGYELDKKNTQYYTEDMTKKLLTKLLKAYNNDINETINHLIKILKWRQKFNPLSCAFKEKHSEILEKVGIITNYKDGTVITWNLYGELLQHKDKIMNSEDNLNKFIRYRVGLMERGIRLLFANDSSQEYMTQIHDYKGVSMWRMESKMRKTVKDIVFIFGEYYPEFLDRKFFVNVPRTLTWVYDIIIKFVSNETKQKFVVLNDAKSLGRYISDVPNKTYGGKSELTLTQQCVPESKIRPTPYALSLFEYEIINEVE
ncbi:Sfh5p SCDLUD_002608 [Saccharomycodes ludwigii]|uniref:Sfh5p n=1 Tax=Saccharomycodes ludwigii TaxID=36035 RepID=UPI001E87EE16|nr:hypothetical protein SCDLUD_002608 [Saccharomycodes ludwigii]KAH3901126.1 hypothetical protein SCDLUD_002608 [Saccharomycodes ludwigii]